MVGDPTRDTGWNPAPSLTVRSSSLTLRKGAAGPTEESGDAAWGTRSASTEVIPVLMSLEEHLQTEVAKAKGIAHTGHRAFR